MNKLVDFDHGLCDRVLSVYFEHTRYLKFASTLSKSDESTKEVISSICHFGFEDSCYINDTGHFNSVEFNICYNQMMYYTIASSVKNGLISKLINWDVEDFFSKQLPDILITKFSSKFRSPIDPKEFIGEFGIRNIRLLKSNGSELLHIGTSCKFYDHNDGLCGGEVDLIIVDPLLSRNK
ncbi:FcoT family thioesterase [Photorhabdus tasmaniensis]|uniref:FcoT family thioesterase n=1 Tax=Photorhabdus tasmaniensis TaxID=1004159 RepID=UPI0040411024